jgi:uncharacterized protein
MDAQENEKRVLGGYDAFARGDMGSLKELLAPDCTWTHLGHSQVAGDHEGIEALMTFFGRSMELSEGTLRVEVEDSAANGERVFVKAHHTAAAGGRVLDDHQVHVFDIDSEGRARKVTQYPGDQAAVDAFWG